MRNQIESLVAEAQESGVTLAEVVAELRRVFIAETMRIAGFNQCRAAKRLGVHRNTLARQTDALGMDLAALKLAGKKPAASVPAQAVKELAV